MSKMEDTICHDSRECFAKKVGAITGIPTCEILNKTYRADGMCAFCKPERSVTDGMKYPFDSNYGKLYGHTLPADYWS